MQSDLGVERIERTDDSLLGEEAHKEPDGARPVLLGESHGIEDRGHALADLAEHRFAGILLTETTIGTNGVEEAQDHDDHQNHPAGLDDETTQAVPGMEHHPMEGGQMVGR